MKLTEVISLDTIATIIDIPKEDFTLYKVKNTRTFHLSIKHTHFENWIDMYRIENKLFLVGQIIIHDYFNFPALNELALSYLFNDENCCIVVSLKGKNQSIQLYKYYYMQKRLKSIGVISSI